MELNKEINSLLQQINADNDNQLTFNEAAIARELAADEAAYSGIGIKALSIIGGVLGSLFILGFIFMAVSGSEGAMMFFGLALIAAAVLTEKVQTHTALDAAFVCAYLAGLPMLGMGADKFIDSDNATTAIILLVAVVTLFFRPGYMISLFAIITINLSLCAFISINEAYRLIHILTLLLAGEYTLLIITEARVLAAGKAINSLYKPLRDGILASLVLLLLYFSYRESWERYFNTEWASSLILIVLTGVALYRIMDHTGTVKGTRVTVFVLAALVLAPLVFAPAVCGAILLLLLSYYSAGYRALVLAVVLLIYFVGRYYYDLNFSLLAKSGMMFGTGVCFLIAWFVLKKQLKHYEEA